MVTLKKDPYDSIYSSMNFIEILKTTDSFSLFKCFITESTSPITSGTYTYIQSLDSEELKTELPKDISNDHLEPVMFNCKNLWKE